MAAQVSTVELLFIFTPPPNEARRLPGLLAALAAQTHPPAEVIVVDGGSTDGTPTIACHLWARALVFVSSLSQQPGR